MWSGNPPHCRPCPTLLMIRQHPHHTWQSWLNRWNNKLSHLSHDALARLERAGADHIAASNAQPPADVSQPARQSPRAPSRSVRSPSLEQSSQQRNSVNGRVAFTENDDMDLMNYRERGHADNESMSRVYEKLARDVGCSSTFFPPQDLD